MGRSLRLVASMILLCGLVLPVAADPPSKEVPAAPAAAAGPALVPAPASPLSAAYSFTDVAGLMNAAAPGYGTGAAWGDYDGDGDLDLYVVNLGPGGGGEANVLLRNDGSTFTDVTAAAGVGDSGPGVAAVWGDMENDGDLDLFVSNRPGSNALYRNEGDGHFTDVATQAGVTDPAGWGEGAAWVDVDSDGLLDLYVANYSSQGGIPNRLFRNLDGLHFVDVAGPLGIADMGNGEGIAWADFDNDGDQDLYIANASYGANALYQQQADGTFLNVAAAMHVLGGPGRSLGAAWGDYDNDGWLDLYVAQEGSNRLYRNLGGSDFADVTAQAGVGGDRWSLGCAWGDYDNDGWLDLHVANADVGAYDPADVLYHNEGGSPVTFSDATAPAGVTNTLDARGSAWGDFDGDGDLDLYVVDQGTGGQPNRLFRNDGSGNHWLHVVLVGRVSNRAAIGARVTVTSDRTQLREVSGGSGFASQDSLPAEFGLGTYTGMVYLDVRWPSGITVSLATDRVDRVLTVTEPAPDLSAAAKAASAAAAVPGTAVTYTVVLPNAGNLDAPARLTDTLPLSLTWGGYVTATSGTPTWDAPNDRLLWSGIVTPKLDVTITYRVTVNPGLAPGLAITNTATVDDGYRRPLNTAPVTLTTLCQPLQVGVVQTPSAPVTGQPVTFTAEATGSLPISFDWDFSDGGTASGQVVSHTFLLDGLYLVTLTATNACGQAVVATSVDVCEAVHGSGFGWTPLLPIVGRPLTLTASAAGRPPIAFAWDLGDGTAASGITVTHTYTQEGNYRVTLTATNSCGQEVVADTVAACAVVERAGFDWTPLSPTAGLAITFTASASGTVPITFTWSFGDGDSGTGATVRHTYAEGGAYTVSLEAANACGQELVVRAVVVRRPAWRIYLPLVVRRL